MHTFPQKVGRSMNSSDILPDNYTNFSIIELLDAGQIAELWAKLTEAAKTDSEARAFLAMFEPWAKARLDRPLS